MSTPMDPDKAQAKLDELAADIERTKRKVADDLDRPAERIRYEDSGSESTGDDRDDQTIVP